MRLSLISLPLVAILSSDLALASVLWPRSYSTGGSCSGSQYSCVDSQTLSQCANGKIVSFACPRGTKCANGYCGELSSSGGSDEAKTTQCDDNNGNNEQDASETQASYHAASAPIVRSNDDQDNEEADQNNEEDDQEDVDETDASYPTAPPSTAPTNDDQSNEDGDASEGEEDDNEEGTGETEDSSPATSSSNVSANDNQSEGNDESYASEPIIPAKPSSTKPSSTSPSSSEPSSAQSSNADYNSDEDGASVVKGISCALSEFSSALTSAGYGTVSTTKYAAFMAEAITTGGITSKKELAMFLAQIIWESGGLVLLKEVACESGCPGEYSSSSDAPGKSYYGRGYMQLSWSANYKECSQDLYGDDRLWSNPDQVATNEKVAWATAAWYWKKHVHATALSGAFGATTMKINGDIECGKGESTNAPKRFAIYQAVYKAFGISGSPDPSGCY
ncbi:lysozyme-like domain-containing protein [Piptocephalis cylindrospora]|uniref:Lysozyme-like domain-containing protein n=1 Tax=Piptocephalis cylindrospora TaxID=1907219 RepID=A0A4P9XYY9_9FUNG|nr:lysozyme-like domain-containing protein [Piptocephalis cylindrospora]|eukprot:RKP11678.1 lysozyme-like domain-containing protein [Piptocephalis cylindrospora]